MHVLIPRCSHRDRTHCYLGYLMGRWESSLKIFLSPVDFFVSPVFLRCVAIDVTPRCMKTLSVAESQSEEIHSHLFALRFI